MTRIGNHTMPAWLTPTLVAFVGSVLLSVIAHQGKAINYDGMLYVTSAHEFIENGFAAAKKVFAWPALPILMALMSKVTGLGYEQAGHVLNALFMAGTCALLVSITLRTDPKLAWATCLAVLAIPGFNEYRHELLREYGCWFFMVLGLWLGMRWAERPGWWLAFAAQLSIIGAALFRPEALAFLPALILWQLFDGQREARAKRVLMVGSVSIFVGITLIAAYLAGALPERLVHEISRFRLNGFDAKAQALAVPLIDFAKDNAGLILFAGSLAIVPFKLVVKLSLFVFPLIYFVTAGPVRIVAAKFSLLSWAIAMHLLVLAVFAVDLQFLAGRYVGPTLLLSTPFVGYGLWLMLQRQPRWRYVIIVLGLLFMVANLRAFSPSKDHLPQAAAWLASRVDSPRFVYIESNRVAYYAGWFKADIKAKSARGRLADLVSSNAYRFFVFEISRSDLPIEDVLNKANLKVVTRFHHSSGDSVIIAVPNEN